MKIELIKEIHPVEGKRFFIYGIDGETKLCLLCRYDETEANEAYIKYKEHLIVFGTFEPVNEVVNSCVVTIRLHYQNIENNEWSCQDGIGAAPIQTEKGAGAMEWDKVRNDAVMKAAPAAESYAIKDAAEKIGKIFGKDLNRKDEIIYDSLVGVIPEEKISISQLGYAEELVRKSTFDDDAKESAYAELANPDLSLAEFTAILNKLKDAQPKKY